MKLSACVCDSTPEAEAIVRANRECRQLISNDGSLTFGVHSTSTKKVPSILTVGLTSPGMRDISKGLDRATNPSVPFFGRTLVLLAGPKEKDQTRINTHALAYTYGEDAANTAKMVFAFPMPRDKSPYYVGSDLDKTFLGSADGIMIQRAAEGEVVDDFRINPSYALGYFDLEAQEFVYNEKFSLDASK